MVQWLKSFSDSSADKESVCNAGDTEDTGLIPGSGRSPEEEMAAYASVFLPGESRDRGAYS